MDTKHAHNSQSSRATQLIASALTGHAPVVPLFVSSMNCRDVVGQSWRWTREIAKQLGVPLITPPGSSKTLIPAQALIEALEIAGKLREPDRPTVPEAGSADELALMRARLGVRKHGGAR
jgi:hypothetical protein